MSKTASKTSVRCAVVGYGPAHSFGRQHGRWIQATPGLEWVAVCDRDPERLKLAREAFPAMKSFTDYDALLADPEIDMVSIITPHHTHKDLAVKAARAGKHVVVEKAMCLNVAEADVMIQAAQKAGVVLAVSHLRRYDGNYQTLKRVVDGGELGEIFEIEVNARGFSSPVPGWYSQRALSGGALFYWGPHAVDWVLQLIPGRRVVSVAGFFQRKVWKEVDVDDHARAILRFDNGACADISYSRIDASQALAPRPGWRVLGDKGAAVDTGGGGAGLCTELDGPAQGSVRVATTTDGKKFSTSEILNGESRWRRFYEGMADCLLRGAPPPVSGEEGRRTIAVMEAAERSARNGREEAVAYEMEAQR